jgi:hypothetical protein
VTPAVGRVGERDVDGDGEAAPSEVTLFLSVERTLGWC